MICRRCKKEIPEGSAFCNFCGAKQEISRTPKKRGNGTGTVWKLPNGSWIATHTTLYKDAEGHVRKKTKSKCFAKKSDALLALGSMKEETRQPKDIPLATLWYEYTHSVEYDKLSDSQRDKMGFAWKRWEDLRHRGIATLTISDIKTQIVKKTNSFYPARDMKVCLSHLYDIAVEKEVVPSRKTDSVDIPFEQPKAKREVWTEAEVAALWKDYETHPFTGYLLIMCYCGLRFGEISTIRLENIHLDERYMIGGIKSDAGIDRQIPIPARIDPVLRALIPDSKEYLMEIPKLTFYDMYSLTISRAGLRPLPPHTCRHYFFSRMTAAGVQGGIIAEVGGHADYLTTLKNYVRIPLEDKLKAVDSI